jgi:outer membrane protein OmpA-like peptidoglycan-associated protein
MRKGNLLLAVLLFVATIATSFAEEGTKKKKCTKKACTNSAVGNNKWSLGIGMEVADFYSPKLKKLQTFKTPVAFGPRIGFWRNFNPSIALGMDLATYAFSSKNTDATLPAVNTYNLLYAGTAVYKFNNGYILKEDFPVAPYIFVKLQGTWAEEAVTKNSLNGFGIPLGAGINWKIANNVALNTYGGYNFGIKNNEDHIFFGAGLMVDLGKGKDVEEPKVEEVVAAIDTDGDGILDIDDDCPTVAGIAQFNGCPDTDGDGIADKDDECPTVAGIVEFNGCPDTDGDGIADAKDACPNVKGEARFGGCPNPDSDGDGIVDSKDACPTVPGPISAVGCPDRDGDGIADKDDKCPDQAGPRVTQGCPEDQVINELNFNLKNVLFDLNKSSITKESLIILDNAAKVLTEQLPSAYLYVDGHTDTRGSASANKTLSASRAKQVVDYLVSKGVDKSRLTSRGFGESQPKVSPEKTEEDYQANRRVELVLKKTK